MLIFSAFAPAQTIVPDEQIEREMIAFARKSENTLDLSRPRIVRNSPEAKKNNFQNSKTEIGKESAITFSLEHKAFDLLNEKRIANGLIPLKWNEELAKIARYHSENMAHGNYFSHQEADGSMVNNRADLFGISNWKSIGENIAFNRGFLKPADSACEQWMQSPAHRENILDQHWKESGIGVAIAADGAYYFTQVFILK
ncbi:MAG: CAP domain-containing protein [Pyrinomonadaceae bacterium]